jgi:hypothetical protein
MIGVPETLRKITFEAIVVDNMAKKQIIITFDEPMPTSSYILTKTKTKTTTKL